MDITIIKMIEKIKNTYLVYDVNTNKVIYSNEIAKSFIGNEDGIIELNLIFETMQPINDIIKSDCVSELDDIYINIVKLNEKKLVNVNLGYFDEEQTLIFLEIEPKSNLKKMFEAMQELSTDLLFLLNIERKQLIFRGEVSKKLNLPENIENFPQSLIGTDAIHKDDIDVFLLCANDLIDGIKRSGEFRIRIFDNCYNWFSLSSVIVHDDYNKPIKVIGKLQNIQKDKDLEFKMSHDILTGTLNKISFINYVTEILHASEENENHALYFVDIDNFRYVNEKFSHAFGDGLIRNIGQTLKKMVRDSDLVGRIGIDEFVIFLPNIDCDETILKKANLILSKIGEEYKLGADSYKPQSSIGIAKYPQHGKTYNELQKKADIALFTEKNKHTHSTTIFE